MLSGSRAIDRGLLAGLRAEHMERQHHPAVAGMARFSPGVAIDLHKLGHLRAAERNAHQVMAEPSGVLEGILGRQRGDPERRAAASASGAAATSPSRSCGSGPSRVTSSSSSRRRTCSSPSSKRARLSSIEMPKRRELVGQKCAGESDLDAAPEIASTMPIWPASFSGLLNTGSTAPVISRMILVIAAAARQEDQRVRAIAAVRMEVVLHRPHVGKTQLLRTLRQLQRLAPVLLGRLLAGADRRKELDAKLHH